MEKYYVELYKAEEGNKYKLVDKKECESMAVAKDAIIALAKMGYDEKNIVFYVVKELPFTIEHSVKLAVDVVQ